MCITFWKFWYLFSSSDVLVGHLMYHLLKSQNVEVSKLGMFLHKVLDLFH